MKRLFYVLLTASIITVLGFSLAAGETGFTVKKFAVGTGVENRELVGAAETFPSSSTVYAFLEANGIASDTEVSVVWSHGGKEMLKTPLQIKSGSKWRTWANKNLMGLKGDWKVELKGMDGATLNTLNFKAE